MFGHKWVNCVIKLMKTLRQFPRCSAGLKKMLYTKCSLSFSYLFWMTNILYKCLTVRNACNYRVYNIYIYTVYVHVLVISNILMEIKFKTTISIYNPYYMYRYFIKNKGVIFLCFRNWKSFWERIVWRY